MDGCTDKATIVDNFVSYFKEIYSCNDVSREQELKNDYSKLRASYSGLPLPCDLQFDTELVCSVLSQLKRGKAADFVNLSAEHLLFGHPVVPAVLSRLFNLILICNYIPQGFKVSYIVPIPKAKDIVSKSLSYDNFRGIAISPIISKVFEHRFLRRFQSLLATSSNQFGFKQGLGCNNAVYSFRKVVDSYVDSGTTTNICSIDLSKAFDKVNHHALFIKLIKRHFPVQLLDIIVNLFTDCLSCVKWDNTYSSMFVITFGVRQGSVLSPILFIFKLFYFIINLLNLFFNLFVFIFIIFYFILFWCCDISSNDTSSHDSETATVHRASERFFIAVVPEPYSASFSRTSLESIRVNSHGCGIGTNNKGKPLFIEILNTSKTAAITVELHHLFYFYIIFFYFF